MQRLLRTKEAAAYCGMGVPAFRAFAKRSGLRRIPTSYRWDKDSIDNLLDILSGKGVDKAQKPAYSFEAEMRKVNRNGNEPPRRKPRTKAH